VAWDGSRAAARALGDAMPLLRDADEVVLLHFPDDKPLVGSLELPQVAKKLRERGLTVRFHVEERGARLIGVALSEQAVTRGAGFLVMGAFTRAPLRERLFGGATRLVLDRPALPTLLSH
ncbi:MAG: universal stress protein, partial [Sphingomonas bacterium]|nr:universal stress protein [Sphingomonas bacterium]